MAASFLDSNVLLYLGAADDTKSNRAVALVVTGGTISIQVLNEVANALSQKRAGVPATHRRRAASLGAGPPAPPGLRCDPARR